MIIAAKVEKRAEVVTNSIVGVCLLGLFHEKYELGLEFDDCNNYMKFTRNLHTLM